MTAMKDIKMIRPIAMISRLEIHSKCE